MAGTEMRTVFSAGNGEVEIYELLIHGKAGSHKISELITCSTCKPLAITRAGKAFIPEFSDIVELGDILTVAATMDGIQSTRINLEKFEREG